MFNKQISFSADLPDCSQAGRSAEKARTAALEASTVIDCVFTRNNLTLHEQRIVLLTIDHETGKDTVSQSQQEDPLPAFITEAITNSRPIEIEKLQALRKFTQEIIELQEWVSNDMINEYLAAGYSRESIRDLIMLTRLAISAQQQAKKPCSLYNLASTNTVSR